MTIFKFSKADTHNVPLGEIFGSVVGKLFGGVNSNPLVAFSEEITSPNVLTDFLHSNDYCVDTTFFNISEGSGLTFSSAHTEVINAEEASVVLLNLNTSFTVEELYKIADGALKNRKKDIIVITLTVDDGFDVAVENEKDCHNRIQVLLAFCESIGEIITAELLERFA